MSPLLIPNKVLQSGPDPKYRQDMETIERYVNGLKTGGGGPAAPVYVVAPSNAPSRFKSIADLVLPGAADQGPLASFITGLPTAPPVPNIFICSGQVNFSDFCSIGRPCAIGGAGQGRFADYGAIASPNDAQTIILGTNDGAHFGGGNGIFTLNQDVILSNMAIVGNGSLPHLCPVGVVNNAFSSSSGVTVYGCGSAQWLEQGTSILDRMVLSAMTGATNPTGDAIQNSGAMQLTNSQLCTHQGYMINDQGDLRTANILLDDSLATNTSHRTHDVFLLNGNGGVYSGIYIDGGQTPYWQCLLFHVTSPDNTIMGCAIPFPNIGFTHAVQLDVGANNNTVAFNDFKGMGAAAILDNGAGNTTTPNVT